MRALSHLSIRSKIIGIILVTNLLGMGLAFLLVWNSTREYQRQDMMLNTGRLAELAVLYGSIGIAFYDEEMVQSGLVPLDQDETFLEGFVYDSERRLFLSYGDRGRTLDLPYPELPVLPLEEPTSHFLDTYLEVMTPMRGEYETELGSKYYGIMVLRFSLNAMETRLDAYSLRLMLIFLACTALALLLSFMLGRVVAGPLLRLSDAATRISIDGDYSIRVETPGGRDEVAILCGVFNKMLDQIQLRQDELERSNRELDHFAYVTTHDLKAPLRAIATLSGWIEEDLGEQVEGESAEHLNLLRGRVQRMEALIDGILQYSRVGRVNIDLEEVDTEDLVREVVELVGVPSSFTVQLHEPLPVVLARRVRLQQVFSNLISNAVKYHDREDGRIEISAREVDGFYEFTVTDDGPGIAPEYHDKVFLIFQTLQSRDEMESTGVGLAVVKKIVESEGGRVSLDSQPHAGAAFRFTWPMKPAKDRLSGVRQVDGRSEEPLSTRMV